MYIYVYQDTEHTACQVTKKGGGDDADDDE